MFFTAAGMRNTAGEQLTKFGPTADRSFLAKRVLKQRLDQPPLVVILEDRDPPSLPLARQADWCYRGRRGIFLRIRAVKLRRKS